ncbi:hypothetical protein Tco_1488451, partial [Tanacetum coccineum]
SKNLTKILKSQMSTHDKNGLGFGTQMDDLSNKSKTDSENSLTVFELRNLLTPRADISFAGLDEFAIRNKIIESKTLKTTKTLGNTNDKCEVHCLTLEACTIYMLADRKYPLSKEACQVMLKMKLLDGKINEVCYKLLKMIEKQAGVRK